MSAEEFVEEKPVAPEPTEGTGAEQPSTLPETPASHAAPSGLIASPLFWLAAFLLLNLAVPFLNIPSRATAIVGAVALTVAFITIVVLFAVSLARLKLPISRLLIFGVLAAVTWVVLDQWLAEAITQPIIAAVRESQTRPNTLQTLQILLVMTFTDLSLLVLAVFAGNIAARMIQSPNMLLPVCAVIAMIDVWGVLFGGIVAQMMEKTPEIAAKAMTTGPQIGAATASRFAIPMPNIGIGDYLFLGLLFGVLVWHGLNWRAAVNWVIPLVAVALLAITFGLIPALPGLLFIALGCAIPNLHSLKYTRDEKFALLYAAVFVAVLTVALYFAFTSFLPEKETNRKGAETQRNLRR